MNDPIDVYYSALERLKSGKTVLVAAGTRITKDSVALEAGRKRGSIKKSRPSFARLIELIESAAKASIQDVPIEAKDLSWQQKAERYRALYEQALSREVNLVHEIFTLKERLHRLTGENVIPINSKRDRL